MYILCMIFFGTILADKKVNNAAMKFDIQKQYHTITTHTITHTITFIVLILVITSLALSAATVQKMGESSLVSHVP